MRWREVPVGQDRSRVEPSHTNTFLLLVARVVGRARRRKGRAMLSFPMLSPA